MWAAEVPDSIGKKIEWDPVKLVAKNAPEVEQVIRPKYREGWQV